jgi:hypothetical protein
MEYYMYREWTATDECGNFAKHTQRAYVNDTQAPQLSVVTDDSVSCDEDFTHAIVTASDNCQVSVTYVDSTAPGTCEETYESVRTYTAVDGNGNTDTTSQTIYVADTGAPQFNNTDALQTSVVFNYTSDLVISEPALQGEDDCSSFTISCSSSRSDGICETEYTVTWACTIVDACGNQGAPFYQTVIVEDPEVPDITSDQNSSVTYECDDENIANPSVTSEHPYTTIELTANYTYPGTCHDAHAVYKSWRAVDDCGNENTWSQTVTVQDTTPPTIEVTGEGVANCTVPEDWWTVSVDDNCDDEVSHAISDGGMLSPPSPPSPNWLMGVWIEYTASDNCGNTATDTHSIDIVDMDPPIIYQVENDTSYSDPPILDHPGGVYATDNCIFVSLVFNETRYNGTCLYQYTMVRTWTATDPVGHTTVEVQTVEVSDTTPPVFFPDVSNICGFGDAPCVLPCYAAPCDLAQADVPTVTAIDNFDGSVSVDFSETKSPGVANNVYNLTRTWTAVDSCGNQATMQQLIVTIDTTPPSFEYPDDEVYECDAVEDHSASDTQNISNLHPNYTVVLTTSREDGSCVNEYKLFNTWTLTDESGNSANETQTITVRDTTAPQWTYEPDLLITYTNCTHEVPSPTAMDNCDALGLQQPEEVVVVLVQNDQTEADPPGEYYVYLEWSATDACGHVAELVSTIQVSDEDDPAFTTDIPEDQTYNCSAPDPITLYGDDNCSSASVTLSTYPDYDCPHHGKIVHEWTIMDESGNGFSEQQTITVVDNAPPSFGDYDFSGQTYECTDIPSVSTVHGTDDCSNLTQISSSASSTQIWDESDDPQSLYQRVWYFSSSDACGNRVEATQTIDIVDTVPPLWVSQFPDLSGPCNSVPVPDVPSAVDYCDNYPDITNTSAVIDGTCPNEYRIVYNFTVTDHVGNTNTSTQTVFVTDTHQPALYCEDCADFTFHPVVDDCDPPEPPSVNASDVCGPASVSYDFDDSTPGFIYRSWTAVDECGNQADSLTQTVTIVDIVDPVFTLEPKSDSYPCSESEPTTPTAEDQCDYDVSITHTSTKTDGTCPFDYSIVHTWTATDDAGNSDTKTAIITVYDDAPPTFQSDSDGVGANTIDCSEDPSQGNVTFTDNCGEVTTTVAEIVSDPIDPPDANGVHITIYLFTAVDECGNSEEYRKTIYQEDTSPPSFEDPPTDSVYQCEADQVPQPNITDDCSTYTFVSTSTQFGPCTNVSTVYTWEASDASGNRAVHTFTISVEDTVPPVFSAMNETVYDECDIPTENPTASIVCGSVTVTQNADQYLDDLQEILVRSWTATSECHSTTATQTVEVIDVTPPVIPYNANDQIECNEDPWAMYCNPFVNENVHNDTCYPLDIILADVTDNCDVEERDMTHETIDDCSFTGIFVTTFTATDEGGNLASAVHSIVVVDTTPPTLTLTPDHNFTSEEYECDEVPNVPEATAYDVCDGSLTVSFTPERENLTNSSYRLIWTWSAVDACGNEEQRIETVRVSDTVPPVIFAPETQHYNCSEPEPQTPKASDNCDEDVDVTMDEETYDHSNSCVREYSLVRTWTATDSQGLTKTVQQTIHVSDHNPPEWQQETLPTAEVVEECEAPPAVDLTARDCDEDMTVVFEQTSIDCIQSDDAHPCEVVLDTLERTWTATDSCGNSITHDQTVTVVDLEPPSISSNNENTTVEYPLVEAPDEESASDDCGDVTVEYEEEKVDGDCFYEYKLVRTWTATDGVGNWVEHSSTVQVEDTTPPTLHNLPQSPQTYEYGDVPDFHHDVVASDNSLHPLAGPGNPLPVDVTSTTVYHPNSTQEYTTTYTFSAEDVCGNVVNETVIVYVQDTTPPTFKEYPNTTVSECDAIPPPCILEASDETENIDVSSSTDDYVLFRVYTWTAIDGVGNTAVHSQTVIVEDTTPPVFSRLPADEEISCSCDEFPAIAQLIAIDNCDNSGISVIATEEIQLDNNDLEGQDYVIIRSWTATDQSGNQASHSQTITVKDKEAPYFVNVPDDSPHYNCEDVSFIPQMEEVGVRIRDNCDPEPKLVWEESDLGSQCQHTYQKLRTWTATDHSGNEFQFVQTLSVEDGTAPSFEKVTIVLPVTDETHYRYAAGAHDFFVSKEDNCDGNPTVHDIDCQPSGDCTMLEHASWLYIEQPTSTSNGGTTNVPGIVHMSGNLTDTCGNSKTAQVDFKFEFGAELPFGFTALTYQEGNTDTY